MCVYLHILFLAYYVFCCFFFFTILQINLILSYLILSFIGSNIANIPMPCTLIQKARTAYSLYKTRIENKKKAKEIEASKKRKAEKLRATCPT